jgi:hypothetical protein
MVLTIGVTSLEALSWCMLATYEGTLGENSTPIIWMGGGNVLNVVLSLEAFEHGLLAVGCKGCVHSASLPHSEAFGFPC